MLFRSVCTTFANGMNKWIRRKRNTLGYGVQSPSDFYFVRHVLRGKSPYYAYAELHEAVKRSSTKNAPDEELCRLLFRLTDYVHPEVILQVGTAPELAAYSMALARPTARHIAIDAGKKGDDEVRTFAQTIQETAQIELLHVARTPYYKDIVTLALPHVCNKTLFIIEGIRESKEKRMWWKGLQQSPLTGVSYDLGTMGLLFFDKTRYKDAYWVAMRKR